MEKILSIAVCGFTSLLLFAASAHAQGGQLVAAEYGAGGHRMDVTERVRSFIHDGMLRFNVTDQMLGTDPARNHVKEIFIRIRHWDGNVEEFRFPEYSHVNLEIDPEGGWERGEGRERREGGDRPYEDRDRGERGFRILRAYYGGEGNFINVTDRLRSLVREGRLHTRADNEHLGVDPDPHIHKSLRVLFWFQGERRNVVVPEHAELNLP
ncbi:MAG TPA: hypothetical protein VI386_30370 [Candidatus Sulfotelmatobacter sp.]